MERCFIDIVHVRRGFLVKSETIDRQHSQSHQFEQTRSEISSMAGRLKSAAVMSLLIILAPANLLFVVICWVLDIIYRQLRQMERTPSKGATILIWSSPATKGLHMARLFHAKGFRVVWATEDHNWLCAARFSNAVSEFYTVPRRETDYTKVHNK